DAFDFQQAPVDLTADLLQVGQIRQALVHSEVIRISKRPFGPTATAFLEILLQIEVLVVDMQTGVNAVLNHPRAELSRRLLGYHAIEHQLHAVGPSQVQVVPDDLLKELTPA